MSIDPDPEAIARILAEEAPPRRTPGVKKTAAPVVRFAPGVGARGLAFTIYCTIEPDTDAALVQQEL